MTAPRPRPDDFAEQAAVLTRDELKAHYHTSGHTIRRWKKEAGIATRPRCFITPQIGEQIRFLAKALTNNQIAAKIGLPPATVRGFCKRKGIKPLRDINPFQSSQPFGKAGRIPARRSKLDLMISDLAGHDRCPVYRCTPDGRASRKGTMIMYGRKVKSVAQIEAKCRRKGLLRTTTGVAL